MKADVESSRANWIGYQIDSACKERLDVNRFCTLFSQTLKSMPLTDLESELRGFCSAGSNTC
jgi:hypothetical protein